MPFMPSQKYTATAAMQHVAATSCDIVCLFQQRVQTTLFIHDNIFPYQALSSLVSVVAHAILELSGKLMVNLSWPELEIVQVFPVAFARAHHGQPLRIKGK